MTLKMITPTGVLMVDVILPGLVFFEVIIKSYDTIMYRHDLVCEFLYTFVMQKNAKAASIDGYEDVPPRK